MKYPADQIDIRVSIFEHNAVVNSIPPKESLPHCEVLDVGHIPAECMAWINILEKKETK